MSGIRETQQVNCANGVRCAANKRMRGPTAVTFLPSRRPVVHSLPLADGRWAGTPREVQTRQVDSRQGRQAQAIFKGPPSRLLLSTFSPLLHHPSPVLLALFASF